MYEVVKEQCTIRFFCYVIIIPFDMHKILCIARACVRKIERSVLIILITWKRIMEKKLRTLFFSM